MARTLAKTIGTTCVLAIALGGCAQLQNFSETAWSGTKTFSAHTVQSVASLLRPAKNPHQVDTAVQHYAAQPDIAAFMRKYARPELDVAIPASGPRQMTVQRTQSPEAVVLQPEHTQSASLAERAPAGLRPASNPHAIAAPFEELAGAPTSRPDATPTNEVSFVKIDGGSNMADWIECEHQAGTVFIPADTVKGYVIAPRFETCMRDKQYLPESEAITLLQGSTAL